MVEEVLSSSSFRQRLIHNMERKQELLAQESREESQRKTARREAKQHKQEQVAAAAAANDKELLMVPKHHEDQEQVALPPPEEYDYEDDQVEDGDAEATQLLQRPSASQRQRAKQEAERKHQLQELRKQRLRASGKLNEATARKDLVALAEGIKLGRASRMEGKTRGALWRFPELSAALTLHAELIERQKAEAALRDRRARLAECPVRHEALGRDRWRRRYWWFPSEPSRLYIETPADADAVAKEKSTESSGKRARGKVSWSSKKGKASASSKAVPPTAVGSRWHYYRSRHELHQLVSSLDERGIREGALRRALQQEMGTMLNDFSAERVPLFAEQAWLEAGPHVGARIRQYFAGVGASEGTVVGYLPPDGADMALWHILHDDGDQEDLEESELEEAMRRVGEAPRDGLQAKRCLCRPWSKFV